MSSKPSKDSSKQEFKTMTMVISLIISSVLLISSKSHLLAPHYPVYRHSTYIIYEPTFHGIFLYQQPWETVAEVGGRMEKHLDGFLFSISFINPVLSRLSFNLSLCLHQRPSASFLLAAPGFLIPGVQYKWWRQLTVLVMLRVPATLLILCALADYL